MWTNIWDNPPAPACQGRPGCEGFGPITFQQFSGLLCIPSAIGCHRSSVFGIPSAIGYHRSACQVFWQVTGLPVLDWRLVTGPPQQTFYLPPTGFPRPGVRPGEILKFIEIQARPQDPPRPPNWCPGHPKIVKNDVKNHP